jgi:fibronectin type 3 domain-containing protein
VATGSAVNLVVSTGPASDTQAPTQPTGFSVSKVNGFPRLTWTASTDNVGVAGYRIHRSTNGSFGPAIATTTATNWTDTAIQEGVRYTYAVVAYDAAGNSSARSVLRSTTAGAAPTAPTTLRASLINGNSQVQLTWNASTDNVGVVEYVIYRSTSGNVLGPEVARVPTPGWVDTTVQVGAGIRYTYAVKARDAGNYLSGRSNYSSVTVP